MGRRRWLKREEVIRMQREAIERLGRGLVGVKDSSLLDSALAQPRATFDGKLLHKTIFEQAAAYAFHIAQNQPFHDGNKRTGLSAAHVFLALNGWALEPSRELDRMLWRIGQGRATKADLAALIQTLCIPRPRAPKKAVAP